MKYRRKSDLQNIKAYFSLAWLNYRFLIKYRFGPIIFFLSNLIVCISLVFLWKSVLVYKGNYQLDGLKIISYIILARIVSLLLFSSLDRRIFSDVKSGDYLAYMLHPWDMRYYYIATAAGQTILHLLWMVIPSVLLVASLGLLSIHVTFLQALVSIIVLVLGYINIQLIKLMIGFLSVNSTIGHRAIGAFVDVLIQILGGLWFPITILPEYIQKTVWYLPFSSMGSISLSILNSITIPVNITILLVCQLLWTCIIFGISKLMLNYYMKTVGEFIN